MTPLVIVNPPEPGRRPRERSGSQPRAGGGAQTNRCRSAGWRWAAGASLALFAAGSALAAATLDVLLATDQTPGDAGVVRVASVTGGVWDRGGRVLMQGRYRAEAPAVTERNAVWVWTDAGGARELYADGDAVPYTSMPVAGTIIALSVPIVQPRFGGYVPPANYWAFRSSVASRPPEVPENRALWIDRLDLPPGVPATVFVVNDLESHLDGAVQFVRPQIEDAIVRVRASAAGLDTNLTFIAGDGGAVQFYFNSALADPSGARSGSMVWQARSDLTGVVSGRSNVVRALAASAGLQLPSLPGSPYPALRVLGVAPNEDLLWEASTNGSTLVLRGEPGVWTPVLGPAMAAPPARQRAPSDATPLGTVGSVGVVQHGAAFMAEATYGPGAGDLAQRAALLLHDGTAPRLFALEGETVEGTVAGTRLERFTPTGYDWPDTNVVAFYGPVRGGTLPFETQALLLAGETSLWLLARQADPLPVPANVDRLVQFRFPVLAAKPDGTVAFAAEVEFIDGRRRELLYTAVPGRPNRFELLLGSGDTFPVATPDGPRTATIRRFTGAAWRPGTFDKLLVSVDLALEGTSAVLLLDPAPAPAAVRLEADLVAGRLRLRWPGTASGTVESTASLALPAWSPSTLPTVERDGFRELEVEPAGAAQFFRLR